MYFDGTEKRDIILVDDSGFRVEYPNAKFWHDGTDENGNWKYWVIQTENGETATFSCKDWDLFLIKCIRERNLARPCKTTYVRN